MAKRKFDPYRQAKNNYEYRKKMTILEEKREKDKEVAAKKKIRQENAKYYRVTPIFFKKPNKMNPVAAAVIAKDTKKIHIIPLKSKPISFLTPLVTQPSTNIVTSSNDAKPPQPT